jgi:hypothetical protein
MAVVSPHNGMRTIDLTRKEGESLADVEALMEGRVFHVTRRAYWSAICASGEIQANEEGRLPSTFGFSANSYFRNRGCVSLFDYRTPPDEKIRDFRSRCWPFQAARSADEGIAILVLERSVEANLISWSQWKEENVPSEMIVPYVEAGHPGPIPVAKIELVILLRIEEDPNSIAAVLRRARGNTSAG